MADAQHLLTFLAGLLFRQQPTRRRRGVSILALRLRETPRWPHAALSRIILRPSTAAARVLETAAQKALLELVNDGRAHVEHVGRRAEIKKNVGRNVLGGRLLRPLRDGGSRSFHSRAGLQA